MPKEKVKEEFEALLAIFERFLDTIDNTFEYWEILEELMSLRSEYLIHHAVDGFGISWEDMLDLLSKDAQELGEEEREQAFVIRAAIDNLCDFAVVEEYQMAEECREAREEGGDLDEDESEDILYAINKKFNSTFSATEDEDVFYAMSVAAGWIRMSAGAELMYMTMGDERVRPWHLQFEGFTAPKASFPQWLIPPIEHQCRCFLVEVDAFAKLEDVQARIQRAPEIPEWFNRTFKESVAKGGRIFSDEHPYFQVNPADYTRLHEISQRIKDKYLKQWPR